MVCMQENLCEVTNFTKEIRVAVDILPSPFYRLLATKARNRRNCGATADKIVECQLLQGIAIFSSRFLLQGSTIIV